MVYTVITPEKKLELFYYHTLGISTDASYTQIQKSYRNLALRFHPDKNPKGEKKFQKIVEAYKVLSKEKSRKIYDCILKEAPDDKIFHSNSVLEIIKALESSEEFDVRSFMEKYGKKFIVSNAPINAGNVDHIVYTNLENLHQKKEIYITYNKNVICETCNGNGGAINDLKTCLNCNGCGMCAEKLKFGVDLQHINMRFCQVCDGCKTLPPKNKRCIICKGKRVISKQIITTITIPNDISYGNIINIPQFGHEFPRITSGDLLIKIHPKNIMKRFELGLI